MIKAGCLGDGDAGGGRCSGANEAFHYNLIYTIFSCAIKNSLKETK